MRRHPLGFSVVVTDPEYENNLARLNMQQAVKQMEAHESEEERAAAYATTPLNARERYAQLSLLLGVDLASSFCD